MLRDVEDTRVVSWIIDDIVKNKPTDLNEMLKAREASNATLLKKSVIIIKPMLHRKRQRKRHNVMIGKSDSL